MLSYSIYITLPYGTTKMTQHPNPLKVKQLTCNIKNYGRYSEQRAKVLQNAKPIPGSERELSFKRINMVLTLQYSINQNFSKGTKDQICY